MEHSDETQHSEADAYQKGAWRKDISAEAGDFFIETDDSALLMVHRNPKQLVISFDNLSAAGQIHERRDPWSYSFFRKNNLSNLAVMAKRHHWFRDPQLIAEMKRLADDGFFAKFETVGLTGTSMGGFAALAFAQLIPGANVVAFSPQSTMIGPRSRWDSRWRKARAEDWRLPFSDAAYDYTNLGEVYVVYDPLHKLDARHFRRLGNQSNLHGLRIPGGGHKTPPALRRIGNLGAVQLDGIAGTLDVPAYHKAVRKRRWLRFYKVNMLGYIKNSRHPEMREPFNRRFLANRRIILRRDKRAERLAAKKAQCRAQEK